MVEVHSQESHLGGDIGIAERVVKLYTVVNADAVGETNMCGVEVAVAVPYAAVVNPLLKQGGVFLEEMTGALLEIVIFVRRDNGADVFCRLAEIIFQGNPGDCFKGAKIADNLAGSRAPVEDRQFLRHPGEHVRRYLVLRQELVHHGLLRQAAHLDGVFLYVSPAVHDDFTVVAGDRDDFQVRIRAETAVELQFLDTEGEAFFQRGVVQEPHVHRFLNLVNNVVGEEDVGYLGLYKFHPLRRLGVGLRVEQCLNQFR